jgi:hypothetical protein
MVSFAPFQRKRAMPNAAIEPMIELSTRAATHTMNEFSVAMPSFPAVHANEKLSNDICSGSAKGEVNISLLVLNDTLNTHNRGKMYVMHMITKNTYIAICTGESFFLEEVSSSGNP